MIYNPCIKCKYYDSYHSTCVKDETYIAHDDEVYGRRLERQSKYPQHCSIYRIREEYCKGDDFEPKLVERIMRFTRKFFLRGKGDN